MALSVLFWFIVSQFMLDVMSQGENLAWGFRHTLTAFALKIAGVLTIYH
jgi:hypothetical protein